jgi:ABC-type multidrug transport system fused ATPase/permease subunit
MPVEPLPLRDIHLPDPVSWWPPAPGWWLLLISTAAVIAAVLLLRLIRRRRQLRRTVRAELRLLRERYNENHDRLELVKSLSALMRRASISFYPRNKSASLTGEDWLQHLDRTAQRKEFRHGAGRILATAPYLPANSEIDTDFDDLLSLCDHWLDIQPVKGEIP